MKLTLPNLQFNEKLEEFDFWITPSLGEIKDSDRYKEVQTSICSLIEIIGQSTDNFETFSDFSPKAIANSIIQYTKSLDQGEVVRTINSLATFLFLVTGKTDNNSKCQFPIYLRDVARIYSFPKVTGGKTNKVLSSVEIPREVKGDRLAKLVAELEPYPDQQIELLSLYVSFIIDSDQYLRSLWTIGKTYFQMKGIGFEKDFLQPLIIFQVRGSVSASGGHEPEDMLRERMLEWGLKPNIDYNSTDIIIKELSAKEDAGSEITVEVDKSDNLETIIEKVEETVKRKTRAYDFVIPYDVKGWNQKIFVQCQFYAGDSGSVSHKNVDQTRTSRDYVKTKRKDPIFLEYIDGAGYFSSLWGDLKKIIDMKDTADFFQVRTAVIKLRGHLQSLGFLTPLEVIHAWALKKGVYKDVIAHLINEGYTISEINRVLADTAFNVNGGILSIDESTIEISRRYLLLDFIAVKGQAFSETTKISGVLLVPAFGKFFGIRIEDIAESIIPESGNFREIWMASGQILSDIQFLADKGWIVQR